VFVLCGFSMNINYAERHTVDDIVRHFIGYKRLGTDPESYIILGEEQRLKLSDILWGKISKGGHLDLMIHQTRGGFQNVGAVTAPRSHILV
jgi:hypothetical protein